MKTRILIFWGAFLIFFVIGCGKYAEEKSGAAVTKETESPAQTSATVGGIFKQFSVYTNKGAADNHFIPSGWMGDNEKNVDITFNDAWKENTHLGSTCIKIVYSPVASKGNRWAGVYWQNPAENWGKTKGGFDLSGAAKLTFWARGENGGERIEEFKMGNMGGDYPDTDAAGIGPVILTQEWKEYTIDLGGKDLSYISGGFCWATNLDVNPEGCTFYLDDIVYE